MAQVVEFVEDLERKFFRCHVCLDQLKEPKQLPCFHRFCQDCLRHVCAVANFELVKCPVCREHTTKQEVADLRTDYFTKQLIEFCQEKKENTKRSLVRPCRGCSREEWVRLYCFKCFGFFCENCTRTHSNQGILQDHQLAVMHIHDYEEVSPNGMESLDRLSNAMRCSNHPEMLVKTICRTCENKGLCIICELAGHEGHTVEELKIVTGKWNKTLKDKVENLEEKSETLIKNIERARMFSKNVQKKAKSINKDLQGDVHKGRNGEDDVYMNIHKDMDNDKDGSIAAQRVSIIAYLNHLMNTQSIRLLQVNTLAAQWIERCNELKLAAHYLSSNDCVYPHVFEAIVDVLDQTIQQGTHYFESIGQLTSIGLVFSSSKSTDCFGVVHVKASIQARIRLQKCRRGENYICSVTSAKKGRLFLSSYSDDNTSEIIETTLKGVVLQRKEFKGVSKRSRRVVTSVVGSKVATVCHRSEVGIYDASDGNYSKTNLEDVVNDWTSEKWITCMTVDHAHEHILIGGVLQNKEGTIKGVRALEILNYNLEYCNTLPLPCETIGITDICLVDDNIVVCDLRGRNAFTMDLHGRLVCRFLCPRISGFQCAPRSACADSKSYVYILWECNVSGKMHKLVMQSTIEGRPLTLRQVDKDAKSVAIVTAASGELKLVVVTYTTRQLLVYSLMDFDN